MAKLLIAVLLFLQLAACSQVPGNAIATNPMAFYGIDTTTANLLKANLITFLDDLKDNPLSSTVIDKNYLEQDPDAFVFFTGVNANETNEPLLMQVTRISATSFMLKLAHTKMGDNGTAINSIYNLFAQEHNKGFHFYSPAVYYSSSMQTYKAGSVTYKYYGAIDKEACQTMNKLNQKIATFFKQPVKEVTYYKFKDPISLFKHLGFEYLPNMYFDTTGGFIKYGAGEVLAANNSEIYEHEFIHLYTRGFNNGSINHYADEGIATLIGGSGGIMYKEGIQRLAQRIKEKNIQHIYEGFMNDAQVDGKISAKYFIGALICKKVQAKHGMAGITQMITANNTAEDFFAITDNLIGLNSKNFDSVIAGWLQAEIVQ